jgi:DNA mismatch repair protein MutS2
VNQVIAGLEAQRRRQETKAQEASKLLEQAERLHQQVLQKAENLKQRERELQLAQEKAVQAAIVEAKTDIAKVIHKLQKGDATAQDAHQATEALNQIAATALPSRNQVPKPKPGFHPQVGDRIRIPRLGQTAEVLNVLDQDELVVRFGLMKMTIALTDIESLTGEKVVKPEVKPRTPPAQPTPPPPPEPAIRTSRNTFDIRGSRVADAEGVLEQAIANASGAIWIIHGHGTGKLRLGVHEFLKQHPRIERFELAAQSEGGSGVTIAYLYS